MKFCRWILMERWSMRATAWLGRLLMRLTAYGYHLHLLTPRQTIYCFSYSNTLTKRALNQLREIKERARDERLKRGKHSKS